MTKTDKGGGENRPDMEPRKRGKILFHDEGSTGWGRVRPLGDYKGNRSEHDFGHLHGKFFDPAADQDPDEGT